MRPINISTNGNEKKHAKTDSDGNQDFLLTDRLAANTLMIPNKI